jgi:hypothetical protein
MTSSGSWTDSRAPIFAWQASLTDEGSKIELVSS